MLALTKIIAPHTLGVVKVVSKINIGLSISCSYITLHWFI